MDDVRAEIGKQVDESVAFSNELNSLPAIELRSFDQESVFRVGSLPIYSTDSLVRHAPSLQEAMEKQDAVLWVHENDVAKFGLLEGKWVRVTQDGEKSILKCVVNNDLMPGTVCIMRGLPRSEKLGAVFSPVELKNLSV